MAPGSEPSAPSWRTPTLGSSTTNASIAATTAPPASFSPCSPPPASSSSPIDWPIYDNRVLTGTILAGHYQPLRVWVLCLYVMGLNLSNQQIAKELGLNDDHVQEMALHLRRPCR